MLGSCDLGFGREPLKRQKLLWKKKLTAALHQNAKRLFFPVHSRKRLQMELTEDFHLQCHTERMLAAQRCQADGLPAVPERTLCPTRCTRLRKPDAPGKCQRPSGFRHRTHGADVISVKLRRRSLG